MTDIQNQINILKNLEENPFFSQRQLAKNSGVSLGKVNYCLKGLIKKGLIKAENFKNSDNKIKYSYLLTPKGISEKSKLTKEFLKLKIEEYDKLSNEIRILKNECLQIN
jgi:EPS-associated MarR family transcriptional regulator